MVKLESILRVTPSRDNEGDPILNNLGLINFRLAHWVGAEEVFACVTNSGQAGCQTLRTYGQRKAGSGEPTPEYVYPLGDLEFAQGVTLPITGDSPAYSGALGPFWMSILSPYDLGDYTKGNSGAFGVHMDWNRVWSPGSDGCQGIISISDGNRFINSVRANPPSKLVVDHGFGTVPKAPSVSTKPLPTVEPVQPLWRVYIGSKTKSELIDKVPTDRSGRAIMTAQVLAAVSVAGPCNLIINEKEKAIRFEPKS